MSKRTVLLVSSVVLALALLGRGADANQGDPLLLGAANSAGSASTTLTAGSTGDGLSVVQTGAGPGLRVTTRTDGGTAAIVRAANPAMYGLSAANGGTTTSSGGAVSAAGGQNTGILATTAS